MITINLRLGRRAGRPILNAHRNARRRLLRRGIRVRNPYKLTAPPKQRAAPAELFWDKVEKNGPVPLHEAALGECWVWCAKRDKYSYGRFQCTIGTDRQRHVPAHRFSFELEHGRQPSGVIRHRCDRPSCVRPSHLLEGTQAENRRDTVLRGREPRGTAKPNARLTDAIILSARERSVAGEPISKIARDLAVPYEPLWKAVRGKTWKHV